MCVATTATATMGVGGVAATMGAAAATLGAGSNGEEEALGGETRSEVGIALGRSNRLEELNVDGPGCEKLNSGPG